MHEHVEDAALAHGGARARRVVLTARRALVAQRRVGAWHRLAIEPHEHRRRRRERANLRVGESARQGDALYAQLATRRQQQPHATRLARRPAPGFRLQCLAKRLWVGNAATAAQHGSGGTEAAQVALEEEVAVGRRVPERFEQRGVAEGVDHGDWREWARPRTAASRSLEAPTARTPTDFSRECVPLSALLPRSWFARTLWTRELQQQPLTPHGWFMSNTAHACTPAKLLSGIVPASRGPNPGKYIGFNSVHPDCKMEQWPMGSAFRERLRGRSMFLIGDCWERRLIEHVCKGKVIAKYDEHEPFAFSCEVMPNVTIGHLHIGGVGELHSEGTAEYMTRRMASMPTQQRVTEMLGRFRRDRLGGRDPTLVLVRGYVENMDQPSAS